VYFTAAETDCDTQALALAYLETLMASYPRVGVFRSFTNGAIDDDAAFLELLARAGRSQDAERAWGSTRETYVASEEDAMNAIVQRFTEYAKDFDAVLVTGLLDGDPVLPGSLDRAGRAAAGRRDMFKTGRCRQTASRFQFTHQLPTIQRIEKIDIARSSVKHFERQFATLDPYPRGLLVRIASVLQFEFFHLDSCLYCGAKIRKKGRK